MPAGAVYLASPVIGQPAAAAAKQLVSVIAGNSEAIEYVKPILNFIGREIVVVSSDVSQGESLVLILSILANMLASKMKLFVNMMLYGNMQVFSEVYALAEATGFPQDKLHEVFGTSPHEWIITSKLIVRDCHSRPASYKLQQQDQ
jgi:3-hydroxyisobutyrate dehydrogenase-like beta-hydroxyacid dehydrogenase